VTLPAERPRRGTPDETRARLVQATAAELEERGYHGTDSNRIAKAAGYAPGTFYKHFADKKAAFLAAYDAWAGEEWDAIERLMGEGQPAKKLAGALVALLVSHHRRSRGMRASLRALVALDDEVRAHHRAARSRQVARLSALGPPSKKRVREGALLMLLVERVCDAIADDELASLGLTEADARAHLERELAAYLGAHAS